ncbi:MerR family transcriptional regulator [Nakamurella lactea]|uniref:helix-turn-helix domain-containing protein n=1 Tax=Nakamurella lactea TaxID=459515 RepID=UPI00040A3501|nr:helix-turn-helix domain-containing protein [Nakamurella lactea]
MTTIEDILDKYGNGLTVKDFTAELDRTLSQSGRPDPAALSSHDRATLVAVGVPEADLDADVANDLIRTRADNLVRLAGQSATVQQVAARLHRTEQRIRSAIADGTLYGIKLGRGWRLPLWQLTEDSPLPQLRRVIAAIPSGTPALAISNLMATPNRELFLDDAPASPADWLLAGGDPSRVEKLIADLLRS